MIHSVVERVPFFTPVESEEKPFLPVLKVFDRYLCFGDEIAVQVEGHELIDGSRVCRKGINKTNCIATMLKIASYVLSLGIFPLIALLIKAIARSVYKFHYASEKSAALPAREKEVSLLIETEINAADSAPEPIARTPSPLPEAEKPIPLEKREEAMESIREPIVAKRESPASVEPDSDSEDEIELEPLSPDQDKSDGQIKRWSFDSDNESDSDFLNLQPAPPAESTLDFEQALSLFEGQDLEALEIAVKNSSGSSTDAFVRAARQLIPEKARIHFQNLNLQALQKCLKHGQTRMPTGWIDLSEESLQTIRTLIKERTKDFFSNWRLAALEPLMKNPSEFIEGMPTTLSDIAMEGVRELIAEKTRAYFENRSMEELQSAIERRRAPIEDFDFQLSDESIRILEELIAKKREPILEIGGGGPLEEIEDDPPALDPRYSADEIIAHFQTKSFEELEDDLFNFKRLKQVFIQDQWVDLPEKSEQALRKMIPLKAKYYFRDYSLEAIQDIAESGELFTRHGGLINLSEEGVQGIQKLVQLKAMQAFEPLLLNVLESAVNEGTATIDGLTFNLSNVAILGIRFLIPVKAKNYFKAFTIPSLLNKVKSGQAIINTKNVTLSAESIQVIKELITEKLKYSFKDESIATLQDLVIAGCAFINGIRIELNDEAVLALNELIAEKTNLN